MPDHIDFIETRKIIKSSLNRLIALPDTHLTYYADTKRGPDYQQAWADECSQWGEYNKYVLEQNKEIKRFCNAQMIGTPLYKREP